MKLNQLRAVVAVAEHGSLRAAARSLNMAQPTLTRSLLELERELGAPLFERRSRGMVETALGGRLCAPGRHHPQRCAPGEGRVRSAARQHGRGCDGRIVDRRAFLAPARGIAAVPSTISEHPSAHQGFYPTLEHGLQDGSIDFSIGAPPACSRSSPDAKTTRAGTGAA